MYTVYNTGDVVFWKPDGSISSVWTADGLYSNEYGLTPSNFVTKMIVHTVRVTVKAIDYVLKM